MILSAGKCGSLTWQVLKSVLSTLGLQLSKRSFLYVIWAYLLLRYSVREVLPWVGVAVVTVRQIPKSGVARTLGE